MKKRFDIGCFGICRVGSRQNKVGLPAAYCCKIMTLYNIGCFWTGRLAQQVMS